MEEDFRVFLIKKNISEEDYAAGSLEDKSRLVEAFENSRGWTRFFAALRSFFIGGTFVHQIQYSIKVPFIPESLIPEEEDKSCYASTMFNNSPDVVRWFRENLVTAHLWEMTHPYDILPNSSYKFPDYCEKLCNLGFKVWPIENKQHATSYLKVVSKQSSDQFITLAGRADYVITRRSVSIAEYLNRILCIIEIQSKDTVELCQLQIQVHLLILMNTKNLPALVGFLILTDGQCQAYKASRDECGGCIIEMNGRFHICHLESVMITVLREVKLIA